jgi:hypothetical protein
MRQGEVDIVEGVNDQSAESVSPAHKSRCASSVIAVYDASAELIRLLGCTMPSSRYETG